MLAGAAVEQPGRPGQDQRRAPASGCCAASRSAIAAPIEMPPTTKRVDAARVAAASTSSANMRDRERPRACRRCEPPWPRHSSVSAPPAAARPATFSATCAVARRPARAGTRAAAPARPASNQRSNAAPSRIRVRRHAHQAAQERAPRPAPRRPPGRASTSGPSKPDGAQPGQKVGEIDDPGAGGREPPVGCAVLGVRHGDAVAERHRPRRPRCARASAGSPCSNRLAGSSTMRSRGEPISSISRRASAADVTTLACSGSMPRSTPRRLGQRQRRRHLAAQVGPGVRRGIVRDGARHWSSGSRVPVHSVTSGMPQRRAARSDHDAEPRQAGARTAGSGWIML